MLEVNRDHRYNLKSLRSGGRRPEWLEMITLDTSPMARNPGGYGQTEVTGMLTFNVLGDQTIGSHGRAAPGVQVRIFDPDDVEVPDGETGEIVARGPTVMNGYWNRPEETAAPPAAVGTTPTTSAGARPTAHSRSSDRRPGSSRARRRTSIPPRSARSPRTRPSRSAR